MMQSKMLSSHLDWLEKGHIFCQNAMICPLRAGLNDTMSFRSFQTVSLQPRFRVLTNYYFSSEIEECGQDVCTLPIFLICKLGLKWHGRAPLSFISDDIRNNIWSNPNPIANLSLVHFIYQWRYKPAKRMQPPRSSQVFNKTAPYSSIPDMFGGEPCRRLQYRNGTGSWKHAGRKWHKRRRWEDWQLSRTAWEVFSPSSLTPMKQIASRLKLLFGQWLVRATLLFIILNLKP